MRGSRSQSDIKILCSPTTGGAGNTNDRNMRNSLLMKLGTLMCVLAVHADIMPVKDFDMEKMAGEWFIVGYASNAQWYVKQKENMKLGTNVLKPADDGDLDLTYINVDANGTCWNNTYHASKTDTPGRFTFHSKEWKNDNDMRIVEVQYDDYAMVHTIKTRDNVSQVLNNLYSRTNEASALLQEKFSQFSKDNGILPDNILIIHKNETIDC
ncbi:lipocalin-like isoform X2 [Paralichthys olivaceus]|uniref:lipocalin-like isoform X2 n=2 Tax=Paralichthys olivaceus TaxID=8255 RepID=UPI0037528E9A